MTAFSINFIVEKNADYSTEINITNESNGAPLNLAGYTAEAKMKKSHTSSTFYNINVEFADRIGGILRIFLTNIETSNIPAGRYVYDVVINSPNGIKTRVVEGIIEVSPGVT
jgi:hypothetical protein